MQHQCIQHLYMQHQCIRHLYMLWHLYMQHQLIRHLYMPWHLYLQHQFKQQKFTNLYDIYTFNNNPCNMDSIHWLPIYTTLYHQLMQQKIHRSIRHLYMQHQSSIRHLYLQHQSIRHLYMQHQFMQQQFTNHNIEEKVSFFIWEHACSA